MKIPAATAAYTLRHKYIFSQLSDTRLKDLFHTKKLSTVLDHANYYIKNIFITQILANIYVIKILFYFFESFLHQC